MEDLNEIITLRTNAENLSNCLNSLLKRIEELEANRLIKNLNSIEINKDEKILNNKVRNFYFYYNNATVLLSN